MGVLLSGLWLGIGLSIKATLGFLALQDPPLPPPADGLVIDSVGDQVIDSEGDRIKGLVF